MVKMNLGKLLEEIEQETDPRVRMSVKYNPFVSQVNLDRLQRVVEGNKKILKELKA